MLLTVATMKSLQRSEDTSGGRRLNHTSGEPPLVLSEWQGERHRLLAIFIAVAAAVLAYTANERSKVHSPLMMMVVAFVFADIYLIQAGLRYFVFDSYKIS